MDSSDPIPVPYFPQFLWKFWLSDNAPTRPPCSLDSHRVHIYVPFANTLTELRRIPCAAPAMFADLVHPHAGAADEEWKRAYARVCAAADALEADAEHALTGLVHAVHRLSAAVQDGDREESTPAQSTLSIPHAHLSTLRKFFALLHYRNGPAYASLFAADPDRPAGKDAARALDARLLARLRRMRARHALAGIDVFLACAHAPSRADADAPRRSVRAGAMSDALARAFRRARGADVSVGIAAEGHEYVMTERTFGVLDDAFRDDPECEDVFFPVTPVLALYCLGGSDDGPAPLCAALEDLVPIEYCYESTSDVHLRNASTLSQPSPSRLLFSSLRSMALSISSFEEFRSSPSSTLSSSASSSEHLDYSRLRMRVRQKATQEEVVQTLVVRGGGGGAVVVPDLTGAVEYAGEWPAGMGAFSDVWRGVWKERGGAPKAVAIKILRLVMVRNVQEKLLKRLKDELRAWHRLEHPYVARLHGVVRRGGAVGMVSPWCAGGTVREWLRGAGRACDRLQLMVQIASGVAYLHNFRPAVVHGDLKSGNILVAAGAPVITDFGLSRIHDDAAPGAPATSCCAGSTRWMARELMEAQADGGEDDAPPPPTKASDVWAFACVCLEIATGELPYAHRRNDHAVVLDVMRGIKPCGPPAAKAPPPDAAPPDAAPPPPPPPPPAPCAHLPSLVALPPARLARFWALLGRCWADAPRGRPGMGEAGAALGALRCAPADGAA